MEKLLTYVDFRSFVDIFDVVSMCYLFPVPFTTFLQTWSTIFVWIIEKFTVHIHSSVTGFQFSIHKLARVENCWVLIFLECPTLTLFYPAKTKDDPTIQIQFENCPLKFFGSRSPSQMLYTNTFKFDYKRWWMTNLIPIKILVTNNFIDELFRMVKSKHGFSTVLWIKFVVTTTFWWCDCESCTQ